MAQVFIPENPREREQLQGASTKNEIAYISGRSSHMARRFGGVDLLVVLALFAAIAFLITAA